MTALETLIELERKELNEMKTMQEAFCNPILDDLTYKIAEKNHYEIKLEIRKARKQLIEDYLKKIKIADISVEALKSCDYAPKNEFLKHVHEVLREHRNRGE